MKTKCKHHITHLIIFGMLLVRALPAAALTGDPVLINEIFASHTGTDNTEFIELFGTPETSLDGLSLIVVESDNFNPGTIDRQIDFGAGDILGSNGFYLVGNPDGLAANYKVTPNVDIFNNFFENSSLTVALVETASIGGDSVTGTEVVVDTVALTDGDAEDTFFFDASVIGPDGTFFPAGARRTIDGVDTDTAADWLISDFNLGTANTPVAGDTPPPPISDVTIMEIQGKSHISPYNGQTVRTTGIVTALAFDGFYVQDSAGDGDDETSNGIFVFTDSSPSVSIGDEVELQGSVSEFIPGGADTGNLSTTRLPQPSITVLSSGNGLPDPVIIGRSGRIPPNVFAISPEEIDPPINLQNAADAEANPYNPDMDGIDFYESLEGMRVAVEAPVAVSATRMFSAFSSEFFTLANDGADAAPPDGRTARGGILLQPDPDNRGDQNPERVQIQLDGTLYPGDVPAIPVGTRIGAVTGVVGYSFGNFEVNATEVFDMSASPIKPETTDLVGTRKRVTVASYNVLNLSPGEEDDNQRATIAAQIVNNLRAPDVVALQEIQDNSGEADDGVVDATLTLQALVDEIKAAGGPRYRFFDVAPEDGTSGGVPGGNIRNAFLYNPKRVKRIHFVSLTPEMLEYFGVDNPLAFEGTRDPLLAVFSFRGRKFIVINNHLTSRFGSTPIFGGPQPFVQAGENERETECSALNQVVDAILAIDGRARVMVVGDLNTFQWTNDLAEILPGAGHDRILRNMIDTIDDNDVYTFIFEGNSQVLDHFFVTDSLYRRAEADIVHVNVDFPRVDDTVGSDHEPIVVRLDLKTRKWKHDWFVKRWY